ncbi:MAG: hypothetical protein A2Y12_05670 [Planctomycetes bacterium GWF2_42_9]|nr:MAG: hypothetical protein A2Y12_05670 [Planctomycetes bacterium GWF2_42_9]
MLSINHSQPDRVPLGWAGINSNIKKKINKYLGLNGNDEDYLLEALDVDLRVLDLPYVGPKIHKDISGLIVGTLWGWRCKFIKNEFGSYLDYCDFPLKNADFDEIEAWPMPHPDDFAYDCLLEQCKRYKDYCIVFGNPGLADIINSSGFLCTMEKVLMDLAVGDKTILRLIDRRNEINLQILENVLKISGKDIDIIWIGEDLGTQNSALISISFFREFIRPRHQKFIDLAKKYRKKVMIHSCGSSSWAFEDFIDMGIDIIDTIQPEAKSMSPAYLKNFFGDKLSFHGAISTAGPLSDGTVDDIIKCVNQTLDIMMPKGGYIMAPTHMIQDNTPPENILAMYNAAKKFGSYIRK